MISLPTEPISSGLTFTECADVVRFLRWMTHAESIHSEDPKAVDGKRQKICYDVSRSATVRMNLDLIPRSRLTDPAQVEQEK